MEFYYSSDDDAVLPYDQYQLTPYTDPSSVKKLWREHFTRNPKDRNREVTRAFQMKCSLFQFIYPELSESEVRAKLLKDLGVKTSSTKSKKSKTKLEKEAEVPEVIDGVKQTSKENAPEKVKNYDTSCKLKIKNKTGKCSEKRKKEQKMKTCKNIKLEPIKKVTALNQIQTKASPKSIINYDQGINISQEGESINISNAKADYLKDLDLKSCTNVHQEKQIGGLNSEKQTIQENKPPGNYKEDMNLKSNKDSNKWVLKNELLKNTTASLKKDQMKTHGSNKTTNNNIDSGEFVKEDQHLKLTSSQINFKTTPVKGKNYSNTSKKLCKKSSFPRKENIMKISKLTPKKLNILKTPTKVTPLNIVKSKKIHPKEVAFNRDVQGIRSEKSTNVTNILNRLKEQLVAEHK